MHGHTALLYGVSQTGQNLADGGGAFDAGLIGDGSGVTSSSSASSLSLGRRTSTDRIGPISHGGAEAHAAEWEQSAAECGQSAESSHGD